MSTIECANLCKRCPRRLTSAGQITHYLDGRVFDIADDTTRALIAQGRKGDADSTLVRQFYGEPGSGHTDDMPPNTTLEDFDACEAPVVVGSEGPLNFLKIRECGAYLVAAARLEATETGD